MSPIFLKARTTVLADCERCGAQFPPVDGGLCAVCGQILCPNDLHGDWLHRYLAFFRTRSVCIRCRSVNRSTEHRATPSAGPADR